MMKGEKNMVVKRKKMENDKNDKSDNGRMMLMIIKR